MTKGEPESWVEKQQRLVTAIKSVDFHPSGKEARAGLDILLTDRQVEAMASLERQIKRFDRSSTFLAVAMVILAAAQLAVAIFWQ